MNETATNDLDRLIKLAEMQSELTQNLHERSRELSSQINQLAKFTADIAKRLVELESRTEAHAAIHRTTARSLELFERRIKT